MHQSERFMSFLRSLTLQENKRSLVDLRQGVSATREHYAYKHLSPYCDLSNSRSLAMFKTIAALYATHPCETANGNLGSAFRLLCSTKDELDSMEKRVLRLLSCDTAEEICLILPKFFSLFKAKKIPFPFEGILKDLLFWGDRTKRLISKEFWLNEEKK